jgi:8-oxo-dGTP pyrophosphatase MutT (NUDIX family)
MLEVEVLVKGQIDTHWSEWFDDLYITYPVEGQTVLTGNVADQAALQGLISRLWDLGLPLISVSTEPKKPPERVIHTNVRAIIERDMPQGREIVLQVRNKPHEGGKWLELPGGRIEPFESLVDALRREVREETGLELTHIEGLGDCIQSCSDNTQVECLAPFAAYQTLRGPVDSLGLYFRCQARGKLLRNGDAAECIQWVQAAQIAAWLQPGSGETRFAWVDRAGLLFYLKDLERSV